MNDYYPFGLTFNSFTRSYSEPQRYKFNEYEVQDEIGTLLSQFRMYDPAIGRFWVQDPMVKENISPYAFANNNPILYMDALGLDTAKHPVLNIDRIAQMLDELKGNVGAQLNYIKSLVTSSDNSEGSDNSSEGSEEGEEGNDSYYETPSWMNGGFSITGPYMPGEGFGRRGGANGEFEAPRLPAWGYSNAGIVNMVGAWISGGMNAIDMWKYFGVGIGDAKREGNKITINNNGESTTITITPKDGVYQVDFESNGKMYRRLYKVQNGDTSHVKPHNQNVWFPYKKNN